MTAWQGKPKSLISQRWRAPPGICEQGHGSSPTPPQSHGGTDPQRAGGISSHDQVSTEAGPSFLPSESSRVWWWAHSAASMQPSVQPGKTANELKTTVGAVLDSGAIVGIQFSGPCRQSIG